MRMVEPFAKTTFAWLTTISFITLIVYRKHLAGPHVITVNFGAENSRRVLTYVWAHLSQRNVSNRCQNYRIMPIHCRQNSIRWIIGPITYRKSAIKGGAGLRGPYQRHRWRPTGMPFTRRAKKWWRCRRSICCRAYGDNAVAMVVIWTGLGTISVKLGTNCDVLSVVGIVWCALDKWKKKTLARLPILWE